LRGLKIQTSGCETAEYFQLEISRVMVQIFTGMNISLIFVISCKQADLLSGKDEFLEITKFYNYIYKLNWAG
jgi:hypothetical protein